MPWSVKIVNIRSIDVVSISGVSTVWLLPHLWINVFVLIVIVMITKYMKAFFRHALFVFRKCKHAHTLTSSSFAARTWFSCGDCEKGQDTLRSKYKMNAVCSSPFEHHRPQFLSPFEQGHLSYASSFPDDNTFK